MTNEHQHEERVRAAVTEALERIEGPDRGRLARIETRLLAERRRRRPNPWWWLLLGLGLAAGTAAAYWGLYVAHKGNGAADTGKPAVIESEEGSTNRSTDREEAGQATESDSESSEDDSPIIYIGQ